METRIYKIGSEISGHLSKNLWQPKMSKFGPYFQQLRNMITNISGTEQDIVSGKWHRNFANCTLSCTADL